MAASVSSSTDMTEVTSQGFPDTTKDNADFLQKTDWQFEFSDIMFRYVSPTILVAGLLGNSFNLIVLQSKSMRSAATSFLLSVLAVSDMGCLLTTLLNQWLRMVTNYTVDMRTYNIHTCRVHYILTFLFHHLSTMTLSFLTTQRVISVYLPLKAKIICSRGNTIIVWTGIAILLAGFNSMAFFIINFEPGKSYYLSCSYTGEVFIWYSIVDTFLQCYVPFTIILIGNILIVIKVKLGEKKMRLNKAGHSRDEQRHTSSDRMTAVLIVVTTSYILLVTPIYVWKYLSIDIRKKLAAFYAVAYHLYELNFSINFILYCTFGMKFRSALKEVLGLEKKPSQTANSGVVTERVVMSGGE